MKAPSVENQPSTPQLRSQPHDRLRVLVRRVIVAVQTAKKDISYREPTVEQIVDRIMALDCGESCDVKLNPRRTRIANLEWLLRICVQQFGTTIDIHEHTEGADVVLTVTVTAREKPAYLPA